MGFFDFLKLAPKTAPVAPDMRSVPCEICDMPALFLDNVDFNKSCEENNGIYLPRSGRLVDYYLCDACGFCFAPEFRNWKLEEFAEKIYNEDYVKVDPDYVERRPILHAENLHRDFGTRKDRIRHLDYGGGSGVMSKILRENGWDSQTYDPILEPQKDVAELGVFNFITAYEVFEHVPDVNELGERLSRLCAEDGIIIFSTICSDGCIQRGQDLTWWYAAPRNGHITLYSRNSLVRMMSKFGLSMHSYTQAYHLAFRRLPDWANLKLA